MSERRWYNPQVPQTLGIAQILLYINAVFLGLSVLTRPGGPLGLIIGIGGVAAYAYGGYGIANGQKRGYQVAVLASFLPLIQRAVIAQFFRDGLLGELGFVLLGFGILDVIFQYALIALLLHPMSREHQKVWFS